MSEIALERKFNNMQRTGCAFWLRKAMVGHEIVVYGLRRSPFLMLALKVGRIRG